jgi:hypothetical protein
MLAPYSEMARSKLASANGACSALAWTSGNRRPSGSGLLARCLRQRVPPGYTGSGLATLCR